MTVHDKTLVAPCPCCGGMGEVRELHDDVEVYTPCHCRGGAPETPARPIGYKIADPTRMREIFDALVATPTDGPLYALRQQIALAMATAADHQHLPGMARLLERGLIQDDLHRDELLSNFRDPSPELADLHEVVSHAPLRVRLTEACDGPHE